MTSNIFGYLGSAFGGALATLFFIIYLLVKYPEKIDLWISYIARLVAWSSTKWNKFFIAKNIEGTVKTFSKKISRECEDVLPYDLKIKWVNKEDKDKFMKRGKIVIKMHDYKEQAKNIVYITLDYLSLGLLPKVKVFIHEKVNKSLEFAVAEKFFIIQGKHRCLEIFRKEFIEPEIQQNTEIAKYFQWLRKLDDEGMLTRIVLKDFDSLADFTGLGTDIEQETIEYMEAMGKVAERKHGERVGEPLGYNGNYLQTAIIFVADPLKFLTYGTQPYLQYIDGCIKEGFKKLYIFARGENIKNARKVAEDLANDKRLIKTGEEIFHGKIGKDPLLKKFA